MNKWNDDGENLGDIFQEGILDRIKSRGDKIKGIAKNVKPALMGRTDQTQNVVVNQLVKYLERKKADMVNDIQKLFKKDEDKHFVLRKVEDSLNDLIKVVREKEENGIEEDEQRPRKDPPPLPNGKGQAGNTGDFVNEPPIKRGPAPTSMGPRNYRP